MPLVAGNDPRFFADGPAKKWLLRIAAVDRRPLIPISLAGGAEFVTPRSIGI